MSIRTLEQAFNAVFHKKESFQDFCSIDLLKETEEFSLKEKMIYRTTPKFKNYLRFIDKVILRHLAKNEDVLHSYIKERSVLTAVKCHAANRAFFLTDIKSFFSNINGEDVKRILKRDAHLIPISDLPLYIEYISNLTTWKGSIPVGFPSSPQLSNSFLFEFDNALQDFCKSESLVYTRYSDDIVISGLEKEPLFHLKEVVQELLSTYASGKLTINEEKTKITHTGNKVKILGLVINQEGFVTVDSKYKKIIETFLHFYITDKDKYESFLQETFDGKEHSLFGLLHYVKSSDPAYLGKLQRKYGVLALRSLMENKWREER